jgi:hypothetical protein
VVARAHPGWATSWGDLVTEEEEGPAAGVFGLEEWFDSEGASCRFSVLYSDVGVYTIPHSVIACSSLISWCGSQEYYFPIGWPSFPFLETFLPPIAAATGSTTITMRNSAFSGLCHYIRHRRQRMRRKHSLNWQLSCALRRPKPRARRSRKLSSRIPTGARWLRVNSC